MINLINSQIKKLYKKEKDFCAKFGYKQNDFPGKKKTIVRQIERINRFLEPLNLFVELKEKSIESETIKD